MLRVEPIRSAKYVNGARGTNCKLRIADVCTGDSETTIFAHIRDRHAGRGQKASDISGADSCFACHDVFDRRAKLPCGTYLSDAEWLFYALRGLQETLEDRIERGLIFIPQDTPKPFHERPAKQRKPPAERKAIQQRADPWPKGRKIPTRPMEKIK